MNETECLVGAAVSEAKQAIDGDRQVVMVDDIIVGIEDALQSVEDLERVGGILQCAVDSGEGLDETSAQMASLAVEAICARVGLNYARSAMKPALESFGTCSSRLSATKLALEENDNFVIRIWKAIKTAFGAMWNVVKGIIGGSEKKIEKEADKSKKLQAWIKKEQSENKDTGQQNTAVADNRLRTSAAPAFSIDGKANFKTAETVLDNTQNCIFLATDLLTACRRAAQLDATEDGDVKFRDSIVTVLENFSKERETVNGHTYYGRLPFGGMATVKFDGTEVKWSGIEINMTKFDLAMDPLTSDERLSLLAALIVMSTMSASLKRVQNELDALTRTCDKLVESKIKNVSAGDDRQSLMTASAKTLKSIPKLYALVGVAIPKAFEKVFEETNKLCKHGMKFNDEVIEI